MGFLALAGAMVNHERVESCTAETCSIEEGFLETIQNWLL